MVLCEARVDNMLGNINGIKVLMATRALVKNGLFIYENESRLNASIK